jgi:hypothetical protein
MVLIKNVCAYYIKSFNFHFGKLLEDSKMLKNTQQNSKLGNPHGSIVDNLSYEFNIRSLLND